MGSRNNRRRHQRVPLNLLIQFRFDDIDAFITDRALDISEGGMFIRSHDVRDEGSLVYLQFTLKDGTRLIEGLGRVVRVNPGASANPGMGIEFLNFDADSRAMIDAIVRERSDATTEDLDKVLPE